MWDFSAPPMASLHATHEIHVLLVDHEPDALIQTAKQLELCQYRVTLVELASAAISMLMSGKTKFDVVIANINSPDLHGFKLLQQAVTMGLPTVLVSVDDNAFMAMKALESGAFLYLKKPATMEVLRYLWQLVMREKTRIIRERELFLAANNNGVVAPVIENPSLVRGLEIREAGVVHENKLGKKARIADDECDSENRMVHDNDVRKKMCTEWTQELHAKFIEAVEILGEGRCFPKEILDLMNVPGLTRMQVASHLQKCRNDNWKSPEERKPVSVSTQTTNQDSSGSQPRPRKFGSKPLVGKNKSGQVHETGHGSGNGSIPMFTYHHKKYGSIGGSGPRNVGSSSNPRHSSDEYFNFPDTDFLIQNVSGRQQGAGVVDRPNPAPGAARFEHNAYNDKQKSEISVETGGQWSSDTSNFESDHSETRGPDN
ncbi:hypothetical protein ACS0TY_012809 [Phlomoides rotata]